MCCKRKGVKQRERHFHEYAAILIFEEFSYNIHMYLILTPFTKSWWKWNVRAILSRWVQIAYVKKTPGKKLLIWTTLSIKTEQFICTKREKCNWLSLSRNWFYKNSKTSIILRGRKTVKNWSIRATTSLARPFFYFDFQPWSRCTTFRKFRPDEKHPVYNIRWCIFSP